MNSTSTFVQDVKHRISKVQFTSTGLTNNGTYPQISLTVNITVNMYLYAMTVIKSLHPTYQGSIQSSKEDQQTFYCAEKCQK